MLEKLPNPINVYDKYKDNGYRNDGKKLITLNELEWNEEKLEVSRKDDKDYGLGVGCTRKMRGVAFFILLHILNIFINAFIYSEFEKTNEKNGCKDSQCDLLGYIADNFLITKTEWEKIRCSDLFGDDPGARADAQAAINEAFAPGKFDQCTYDEYEALLEKGFDTSYLADITDGKQWYQELGKDRCATEWEIMGSAFFVTTVATTVGYGNTSPQTTGGRIWFMFSVLPCVLVGAMMVAAVGDWMKFGFDGLAEKLARIFKKNEYIDKKRDEVNDAGDKHILKFEDNNAADPQHKNCSYDTCIANSNGAMGPACGGEFFKVVIILLVYFLLPVSIYHVYGAEANGEEDDDGNPVKHWGWTKALYFHMVSSTTVGFGDLTLKPSENGGISTPFEQFVFHTANTLFLYAGLAVFVAYMGDVAECFGRFKNYANLKLLECDNGNSPRMCKCSDNGKWNFIFEKTERHMNEWKPEEEAVGKFLLREAKDKLDTFTSWSEADTKEAVIKDLKNKVYPTTEYINFKSEQSATTTTVDTPTELPNGDENRI